MKYLKSVQLIHTENRYYLFKFLYTTLKKTLNLKNFNKVDHVFFLIIKLLFNATHLNSWPPQFNKPQIFFTPINIFSTLYTKVFLIKILKKKVNDTLFLNSLSLFLSQHLISTNAPHYKKWNNILSSIILIQLNLYISKLFLYNKTPIYITSFITDNQPFLFLDLPYKITLLTVEKRNCFLIQTLTLPFFKKLLEKPTIQCYKIGILYKTQKSPIKKTYLIIFLPLKKMLFIFYKTNFCTNHGFPLPQYSFHSLSHNLIIKHYNIVLTSFLHYYKFTSNFMELKYLIQYILISSCAKLLATKFKLKSTRKAYKKFGKHINFGKTKFLTINSLTIK